MTSRKSIRAIMLTPQGRMLLMQIQEPSSDFRVWFAPGGGIEAGESPETCLKREILEETGRADIEIGPLVWRRHHTYHWNGDWRSQDEEFHLVPTELFTPEHRHNPSEPERLCFRQFRWWIPDEIEASTDVFAPRLLAHFLRTLSQIGPPDVPVDVGI